MKILTIWGHLHERYPGEYMPDLLDAWTEYQWDENPQGYADSVAKHKADESEGREYRAVREIVLRINEDDVLAAFDIPEVVAKVEETP